MSLKWVVDCSQPTPIGHPVPMTADEEAQKTVDDAAGAQLAQKTATQQTNFQTMADALKARMQECIDLANAIEAGTATVAERARAQVLCLRGTVRLTRLYLELWDQAA